MALFQVRGKIGHTEAVSQIAKHRKAYLVGGIALAVLGLLALALPTLASLTIGFLLGAVLFVAGLVRIAQAVTISPSHRSYWASLLAGGVAALIGVLILTNLFASVSALVLLIAIFALLEGALRLIVGVSLQPDPVWGWVMGTGVVTVALGVLVLVMWPEASLWLLGVVIGIHLLMDGLGTLVAASLAKSVAEPAGDTPDDEAAHG